MLRLASGHYPEIRDAVCALCPGFPDGTAEHVLGLPRSY
jgi:hypothetical protein